MALPDSGRHCHRILVDSLGLESIRYNIENKKEFAGYVLSVVLFYRHGFS